MKMRISSVGTMVVGGMLSAALLQNVARAADPEDTLTLAEVKISAGAHFDKIDKDGDSTLDSAEVKGLVGPTLFKTADADHDGTLSKEEYLALVEEVFKKADVDNDGSLTVKELKSRSGRELKKLID